MIDLGILIIFGIWILYLLQALVDSDFVMSLKNPYNMDSAMVQLKKLCISKDEVYNKLIKINDDMFDCPPIDRKMLAIEVADFGDLKALIGGDESGKPRLFAFNARHFARSDYRKLSATEGFKNFGLKYSISADELKGFLNEASKAIFENKLLEQSHKNVVEHFDRSHEWNF